MRGSQLTQYHGRGENEPTPAKQDAGAPYRPRWLADKPLAVECWDYNVARLARMGVLTTIDRDALARYCVMFAQWRAAVDYITEHGPTVTKEFVTKSDVVVVEVKDHPAVARMLRLDERLTKLGAKFGLTPADRANMTTAPPQAKGDDLEDRFLKKA